MIIIENERTTMGMDNEIRGIFIGKRKKLEEGISIDIHEYGNTAKINLSVQQVLNLKNHLQKMLIEHEGKANSYPTP